MVSRHKEHGLDRKRAGHHQRSCPQSADSHAPSTPAQMPREDSGGPQSARVVDLRELAECKGHSTIETNRQPVEQILHPSMMMKRLAVFHLCFVFSLHFAFGVAYGDSAVVLPKGVWRMAVNHQNFFPFDERFDRDGKLEALGTPFSQNLSGALFGIGTATQTIGNSVVSIEREGSITTFQPAYGVTDKFSIGLSIPYFRIRNSVKARLDTTNANFGQSAIGATFVFPPFCPCPLVPLSDPFGFGDVVPLTTDDVQNLLGDGIDVNGDGTLDVNTNLGFQRVEDWSGEGVGDITLGARYQYYNSEYVRAAFTGGVRVPTGKVDDPDNLIDSAMGDGTTALLFQFQQDFLLQPEGIGKRLGFPSPGSLLLNTTFKYDLALPDKEEVRVCDVNFPICPNKDTVRRDLGDAITVEFAPSIGILIDGLILQGFYTYIEEFKDHNTGDKDLPYGVLAIDSTSTQHIYIVGLSYTTLPLVVQKRFPIPFAVSISFRDRFAGTNFVVKSQSINFSIETYF